MVGASIAATLDDLSRSLAGLGRMEDALAVSEEAVEVYRELAADQPGEFRAQLGDALGVRAALLAVLGREEEAAAARAEAGALATGDRTL